MASSRRNGRARRQALHRAAGATVVGLTLVATGSPTADAGATPRTYQVEGQLETDRVGTVRATGDFVGTYRSIWENEQSAVAYGATTLTVAEGIDGLVGCLDRDHDGRCGAGEPTGTVTMTYRRVSAYRTASHTLVESSDVRPVVATSGSFTGGLLYLTERAARSDGVVVSDYRGELSVNRW